MIGPENTTHLLPHKTYLFSVENGRAWARVRLGREEPYELPDRVLLAWGNFSIAGVGMTPRRPARVIDRKTRDALLDLAGATDRPPCPNFALAWSLLFDAFGTSPGPDLVRRFARQLLPGPELEPGAAAGFSLTGEQISEWLDEDCVIDYGEDNFCVLADSEGPVRRAIRGRRGL
jgi:hypothetical protein